MFVSIVGNEDTWLYNCCQSRNTIRADQVDQHSLTSDQPISDADTVGWPKATLAGWTEDSSCDSMEELLTDNSTKPLQRKHLNWNKALRIELLPSLPNKSRTQRKFVAAHKICKLNLNPVTKSPRVNLHWFRQCSRPIHSAHKKTSVRTPTLSQDARRVSVAISPP